MRLVFLLAGLSLCVMSGFLLFSIPNQTKPIQQGAELFLGSAPSEPTTMHWNGQPMQKETIYKTTTMTWQKPFSKETSLLLPKESKGAMPNEQELKEAHK